MSDAPAPQPQPATGHTAAANERAAARMAHDDRLDFDRIATGMIGALDPPVITGAKGNVLWDSGRYEFLRTTAPPEVHPSLWRQAQLNVLHGLFEVVDGIYQVRGYDLSNITFVRTDTGWIVIDPLTVTETAAAARALVDAELGHRPVVAIIYTHSHVDHFGGVRGIVTDEEVASGAVRIIAPEGFLEAAVSENVIAGPAMRRRAMYMYGILLPVGIHGHVDAGLGKATPLGSTGLIAPTESVDTTGAVLHIDGIDIEMQMTPGTEAPAEMNFWFPQYRALCMAENCTATLHNVYTPRGAEIRDALSWSRFIDESITLFVDRSDVAFASHHWPRWGATDIEHWLAGQRDTYRFIHDETMRLVNHGFTALEIAETLELPAALGDEFFNRGYYGTVSHNVKAVYQRYLGWFDANPANLHPLPPQETAAKIVEYMGGADTVLARARVDFDAGEYRWVAQVVNHVVFADPTNAAARQLQADALEQLGYQSESGPWRDFYLTGAQELRNGTPSLPGFRPPGSADMMRAMTPEMVLDLCGVKLNGRAATDVVLRFDITFDTGWSTHLVVEHGVIHHSPRRTADADAAVHTSVESLVRVANELSTLDDELVAGSIRVEGDVDAFRRFLALLDQFDLFFPIIEP